MFAAFTQSLALVLTPVGLLSILGGVLCGIASLIIQLVKDYRRRNDDGQGAGQPGRTK